MGLGQLLFSLGLTAEACCSSTVQELSLSPGEEESHLHPVIASTSRGGRSNLVVEDGIATARQVGGENDKKRMGSE